MKKGLFFLKGEINPAEKSTRIKKKSLKHDLVSEQIDKKNRQD